MARDLEYQCKRMLQVNYLSLAVLIDYLLAPVSKKYSITSGEVQKFHKLHIDDIFELLVHVPGCDQCKQFYEAYLNVQVELNLERIDMNSDKYTKNERIHDLRTRIMEALEVIR